MTIGCVRCGASMEGDIITSPISFTFKHESGCGMGIGPLCVLKGKITKRVEEKKKKKKETKVVENTETSTNDTAIKEDIRVESIEETEESLSQ
jgi:hypothetical protein